MDHPQSKTGDTGDYAKQELSALYGSDRALGVDIRFGLTRGNLCVKILADSNVGTEGIDGAAVWQGKCLFRDRKDAGLPACLVPGPQ